MWVLYFVVVYIIVIIMPVCTLFLYVLDWDVSSLAHSLQWDEGAEGWFSCNISLMLWFQADGSVNSGAQGRSSEVGSNVVDILFVLGTAAGS